MGGNLPSARSGQLMATSPALIKSRAKWREEHGIDNANIPISRFFEMPRSWTFQMPKLRAWVEARLEGPTLNLFGGVTTLVHPGGEGIHHNEINPDLPADS